MYLSITLFLTFLVAPYEEQFSKLPSILNLCRIFMHCQLFSQVEQLTDQFCNDTDILLEEKTKELLRK